MEVIYISVCAGCWITGCLFLLCVSFGCMVGRAGGLERWVFWFVGHIYLSVDPLTYLANRHCCHHHHLESLIDKARDL